MPLCSRSLTTNSHCEEDKKNTLLENDASVRSSTPSLFSDFQLNSTEIGEILEMPNYDTLSTSAVLHYCKNKILQPYLRLLGVMGLRPSKYDEFQTLSLHCFLTSYHTVQVTLFVCIGYILQYLACFRRDRGFCYKKLPLKLEENRNASVLDNVYNPMCYGSVPFSYLIPNLLHLAAYLYTVYLFRIKENEQLQNLMERVFLLSSNPVHRGNQKRLVAILWLFIALGIIWITMACLIVTLMTVDGIVHFHWLIERPIELKIFLKILLVICTLWHDMIQGTIITSYCLQGQLLISHLFFLRAKLFQHALPLLEWMKEISEFKKLLKYFNDELGPAVCIYTMINISWACAGIVWMFYLRNDNVEQDLYTNINIMNCILWIMISIAPFIQAARLTTTCSMIQNIGHEIRTRPYVYQGTPGDDLDTLLLYTSSLRICARLYRVPITGRYLCALLTVGSILTLIAGQFQFFN